MYAFCVIGSLHGAPKSVGIISLSNSSDVDMALQSCLADSSWSNGIEGSGLVHAAYTKHKSQLTFLRTATRDLLAVLDVAKVADVLLLVVCVPSGGGSSGAQDEDIIDAHGQACLSALRAVGCPDVLVCVQGLGSYSGKGLIDARRQVHRQLCAYIGPEHKSVEGNRPELLCRQLCNITPRAVAWRNSRSYLLADAVTVTVESRAFESHSRGDGQNDGTEVQNVVRISGYLRGKPLSVNSLAHVVGSGTGRIDSIRAAVEPFPGSRRGHRPGKGHGQSDMATDDVVEQAHVAVADRSRFVVSA